MEIHKVLNNNFVIAVNEFNEEIIVGGKGIAFGKRKGDVIDSEIVNKTFVVPVSINNHKVLKYVESIPHEFFEIAISVVSLAKVKTEKEINDSVCLTIADHMHSSVLRYQKGITIPNYMLWEVKKFYATEYEVGLFALNLIEKKFGIKLPVDESGFIALHVIDAQLENSNIEQVHNTANLIKDVCNIVKYYFNVDFDDDSIYYYRFITHLKFFASRLFNDYLFTNNEDEMLYEMIKKSYINSFNCTLKIGEYISHKYNYVLSKEEIVYLTIHIENVIYKSKKYNR